MLSARISQFGQQKFQQELFNIDGSNSVFVASEDESERLLQQNIHPTAPLWGANHDQWSLKIDEQARFEANIIMQYEAFASALDKLQIDYTRRATRARVMQLQWNFKNDQQTGRLDLILNFSLQRGCYATSVLRELVDVTMP